MSVNIDPSINAIGIFVISVRICLSNESNETHEFNEKLRNLTEDFYRDSYRFLPEFQKINHYCENLFLILG